MSGEEPGWLLTLTVLAIHDAVLSEHGGLPGLRSEALLESALGRPKNLFVHGKADVFSLAASYAAAIAQGHPFHDGNKRTGFLAAYTFLRRNGFRLQAPEEQAVLQMVDLANQQLNETDFAAWLRENCVEEA